MSNPNQLERESLETKLKLASQELESLVLAGKNQACEAVLAVFPEIASNRDGVLELIYLEYVLRTETGEKSNAENFASRFPEYYDDITRLLQVDQAMRVHETSSAEQSTVNGRATSETMGARNAEERRWSGVIGDYFLLEVLGRGGMGVVYRARQNRLNRIVALKTLDAFARLDSTTLARFQVEAQLAARLQHPNIVQIYEVGTHASTPFFSMELVRGGNLQDATRERPLQPIVAARILSTLSQAVQYAHSQGVIHRDLKPANILLAPSDRSEAIELRPGEVVLEGEETHRVEIKIADFGLAKHLDAEEQRTQSGAAIGTPSYMAPEQIQGGLATVGPASDIYSIGAILYSLLVGRPPFHAATVLETLHQVGNEEPVAPRKLQSRVPRDLETICLTCLRKEPHRRYARASELVDDLHRFLDGRPIHARSAGPVERSLKWMRRNPSVTALLVSILVATMSITWLWRRAESSSVIANEEKNKANHLVYARDISLAHFEYQSHHVERCQEILQSCPVESRNWEWNYLKSLCKEHLWESPNAGSQVLSVALSPNGRYVAGGFGMWGVDQTEPVRVWDVESNKLLWELNGHKGCVHSVNFSPDGSSLITSAVVWTSDNRKAGAQGRVIIWNLSDGTPRMSIDDVSAVASCYFPDGKSILVGTDTGKIIQYDSRTGEKTKTFTGHANCVLDISISFQGDYFASTAKDQSLRIWNIETGKFVNTLWLHPIDPFQLDWAPNGQHLVVGGWSGEFLAYEVSNMSLRLMSKQMRKGLPIVKYSPDGQYLVTAVFSEGADLKDSQLNEVLQRFHGHNGNIRAVSFDGTGSRLATGGADGCIRLWDLANPTRSMTRTTTGGPYVAAMANNPVRPEVALAPKNNLFRGNALPRIELRNPSTLALLKVLEGHTDWVNSIDYRSDGSQLISGSIDKSVRLWDVATGKQLQLLSGHEHSIVGVAIFDKDERAISGDQDGHFKIWSLASGSLEREWNLPNETVTSISLCAERSILAVGTSSGTVSLWQVRDGTRLSSCGGTASILHVQFSPDGQFVAATREKSPIIEVWKTNELLRSQGVSTPTMLLAGNVDVVNSISFSADSQRLVSSGRDESVRIYNHVLGHELLNLHIVRGINNIVHFGPSGELLYSEEHRLYGLAPQLRRGSDSELPIANQLAVAWHKRQVNSAKQRENWFASVFHQTRLLELEPPTAKLLFNNGIQRAYLGDYDSAERELRAALELKDSTNTRSCLALVCLRKGKVNEYSELCQRMMEDDMQSAKLNDVNSAVWVSCISEESGIDANLCLELMEKAVAVSAGDNKLSVATRASYENTLALVQLRAKKYQEAIDHANKSLKLGNPAPMVDYTILSMCYAKLGQPEKARTQLGLAIAKFSNNRRIVDAGLKLSSTVRNLEAFEFPLLLSEAKELVQRVK